MKRFISPEAVHSQQAVSKGKHEGPSSIQGPLCNGKPPFALQVHVLTEQDKTLLIITQLWPPYRWHKSKQYKDAKIFTNAY